jgi:hypothetical protein
MTTATQVASSLAGARRERTIRRFAAYRELVKQAAHGNVTEAQLSKIEKTVEEANLDFELLESDRREFEVYHSLPYFTLLTAQRNENGGPARRQLTAEQFEAVWLDANAELEIERLKLDGEIAELRKSLAAAEARQRWINGARNNNAESHRQISAYVASNPRIFLDDLERAAQAKYPAVSLDHVRMRMDIPSSANGVFLGERRSY